MNWIRKEKKKKSNRAKENMGCGKVKNKNKQTERNGTIIQEKQQTNFPAWPFLSWLNIT